MMMMIRILCFGFLCLIPPGVTHARAVFRTRRDTVGAYGTRKARVLCIQQDDARHPPRHVSQYSPLAVGTKNAASRDNFSRDSTEGPQVITAESQIRTTLHQGTDTMKVTRSTSLLLLITLMSILNSFLHHGGFGGMAEPEFQIAVAPTTPQILSQTVARRPLPLLHEKGGLVVFLHVAKTGGTTIRQEFGQLPKVDVKRVFDKEDLDSSNSTIDWFLSKENNKDINSEATTLLLEIHGGKGEPMTIFEIHPYIQKWRAQAKVNEKNVFVVTLLREPESFYVSYFNVFKNPGCTAKWCDSPTMKLTEENLLASAVPNHQCQFLARKVDKHQNSQVPVSREECQSVFQLMKADLDWVGFTETMQETTLPLLFFSLSGNTTAGRKIFEVRNKFRRRDRLSRKKLTASALQHLANISSYDRELYDNVAGAYSLDMWENYNATALLL